MSSNAAPFEDRLLGPPLVDRACGDCIACCVLFTIDARELQKPAGVVCPHCTGSSCSIYDRRPQVCRNWFCAWRRIEAMAESARPDKLRVVFELIQPTPAKNILSKLYIRGLALDSIEDFTTPGVAEAIELFRRNRIPVWLDHGGRMGLAHPRKPIADVLLRGLPPESPEVAKEAEEWRLLYADM